MDKEEVINELAPTTRTIPNRASSVSVVWKKVTH